MKRLILAIIVVCSVFYFVQPPKVLNDSIPKVYTEVEKNIEAEEEGLSLKGHAMRFIHFQDAVQKALHHRVSAANYVPADQIPTVMKEAIVATEDKRFYEHPGIDFYGIARAFYVNSMAGETVEGGSTITQQLVKNLFLSPKRVWTRKVEEVALAFMMEHYYTKEEILAMYLNSIYYGNHYYGIKEASEGYFNESPQQIKLAQAALLAGLPQAPTFYNPKVNPIAAVAKRDIVLELMMKQHMITKLQADTAKSLPLLPVKKPEAKPEVVVEQKKVS